MMYEFFHLVNCFFMCILFWIHWITGPSEENSIESIIDNNKSVGDSSADGCDISNQTATTVNQPAQLSIATVNASNIDAQQVSLGE